MSRTKIIFLSHNNCNIVDTMPADEQQKTYDFSSFRTNVTICSDGKTFPGTTPQLPPAQSFMIIPQALKDKSKSLFQLITQYNSINPNVSLGPVLVVQSTGQVTYNKSYLVKSLDVQSDPSVPVSCEIQICLR
jgi:hypothetical protein